MFFFVSLACVKSTSCVQRDLIDLKLFLKNIVCNLKKKKKEKQLLSIIEKKMLSIVQSLVMSGWTVLLGLVVLLTLTSAASDAG